MRDNNPSQVGFDVILCIFLNAACVSRPSDLLPLGSRLVKHEDTSHHTNRPLEAKRTPAKEVLEFWMARIRPSFICGKKDGWDERGVVE